VFIFIILLIFIIDYLKRFWEKNLYVYREQSEWSISSNK
jgi:hypothetical protein